MFMEGGSYDDPLELFDDFYLLFMNKYGDLITLAFKTILISTGASLALESELRKRSSAIIYES